VTSRPTDKELAKAYRRLRSVPAVASELGVAFETARRWLLSADIQLQPKGRPSKPASTLDLEAITRRYLAGDSIATIGEAFGVSPATVRARLLDAGVEMRPRRGWTY
jgi:hypothetical protein